MQTVRFAIVGLGNIAKTHMVALQAMKVWKKLPALPVLDTLITRHPDNNRMHAEAIGFRHITSSLKETLESREIDVVDLCTPNAAHLEDALLASSYQRTLYIEKPLTERYSTSQRLVEAAMKADNGNKPHQVALVYRYHPAVMRIREALRQGVIGEVLQCRASYRRSGYLNASRPVSWRLNQAESGGGAITDLGVHVLDLLAHCLGEITSVSGRTNIFVKERPSADGSGVVPISVDDWALMHVTHSTGVLSIAEVSRIAWGSEAFQIDIVGTKGSLVCDLEKEGSPRVKLLDGSAPTLPQPASLLLTTDEKSTMGMLVNSHFGALHHFLYRVAGEDQWEGLAPTLQDALTAEKWVDLMLQQAKNTELAGGERNE